RLAWNTLSDNNIPFEIVKEVKSQFDAFKIVKNSEPSDNLYTFLNASYFKGNDVLKDETQHVISLVQTNYEKPKTKEFINYLIVHSQDLIAKQGFIPIKPWKIKDYKE
ncbi:MAG: LysR family transcriptional regulator, partial [Methanobrevibacter sp.]|nr:LysR family transcriptional regulator [Methanobrevibacter sp.]